jgi:signal peptidase I
MTASSVPEAVDRRSRPRHRRSWLAALLAFLAPGAGQLYNGEPRAAIWWFAAFVVLNLGFFFGLPNFHAGLPSLGLLVALSVACLVLQVAAAVHAFIHARRAAPAALAPFQRGWLYAVMLIALPTVNIAAAPPLSIKSYYTPSGSNVPTLLVGDRFFVELGAYRDHPPRRGDMAVFRLPTNNRVDYVKRIVGLPGDTVQMRDGVLYLNGEAVPRQPLDDYQLRSEGSVTTLHQYVETLPEGSSYRIVKAGDHGPLDNTQIFTVPPAHYFALGDNRDNSLDSRVQAQFGYVPEANLIGRAYVVYWPPARLATLD